MLTPSPIAITSAILGIANHLYFKNYEPVRKTVLRTASILFLQPTIELFLLHHYASANFSKADIALTYLLFFSSLGGSIVLYRVSPFHPLAKVPGPMMFKITKFWKMYICWKGQQHSVLKGLHERYGPVVRTGPNDVSVTDFASVKVVLGSEGLPKGAAYLRLKTPGSPHNLTGTNGQERIDRRRIWNRGFTSESLKEYHPIITAKGNELSEGLLARAGKELDLTEWLNFFTFDFMAEMMFGYKTEILKNGRDVTGLIELIATGSRFAETIGHTPWLTYLSSFIPSDAKILREIGVSWGKQRIEMGANTKDLWYHLTDEEGHEPVKPNPALVVPDSLLAIIAGSDTTATGMANFFWCIFAHPKVYERVRDEVDKEYPPDTDPLVDTSRLGNLPFLKACLNESLRIFPPVITNITRVVPKGSGGKFISGYFLPENTQIQIPPIGVHYNPSNFSPAPESFIPDRWISSDPQEFVTKREALIPFSYGPANCVGKHLAMQEMMIILTMAIQRFDFEFAPGFEWERWPEKKVDIFTTMNAPLKVVVRPRM